MTIRNGVAVVHISGQASRLGSRAKDEQSSAREKLVASVHAACGGNAGDASSGGPFVPAGGSRLLIQQGTNYMLWDWQREQVLPWLNGQEGVRVACWHPNGSSLAMASPSGGVHIRAVPSGQVLKQLPHDGAIAQLVYSRQGDRLAIASDVVRIWDAEADEFLNSAWPHPQTVHAMFFNDDGSRLITADTGYHARVFAVDDPDRPAPLFSAVVHRPARLPSAPAWVDSGRGLITITDTSELTWWDSESGEVVRRIDTSPTWGLTHVASTLQGNRFAAGGYYGPGTSFRMIYPNRVSHHSMASGMTG